jgi:hypothetical protein
MEKSLNFEENLTRNIWQNLELAQVEPRQLSPLVLAYIGDSIYDLVIRNQPWQHAGQQNQPACVQAGQGGNAV